MIEVDAKKLEASGLEVRKALALLRSNGHPDGCACKLCNAGRFLDSAYARLEADRKGNGHARG